jgi:PKD repeat protein
MSAAWRNALIIGLFMLVFGSCKKDDPNHPSVENHLPVASFSSSDDGRTVSFEFTGEYGESYLWQFGDGESSTEKHPTHTYAHYGYYTVVLTTTNSNGEDSDTLELNIVDEWLPDDVYLTVEGADGACFAYNTYREWSDHGELIQLKSGSAVAWFAASNGLANVRDVSFAQNSYRGTLSRDEENAYHWREASGAFTGFKKGIGPSWTVEGGEGHGYIVGLQDQYPFPVLGAISSPLRINSAAGYTLMLDGAATGVDQVVFAISGSQGTVYKMMDASSTSATFSSAELLNLGKGLVVMRIYGYHIYELALGAKTYAALNASVIQVEATLE